MQKNGGLAIFVVFVIEHFIEEQFKFLIFLNTIYMRSKFFLMLKATKSRILIPPFRYVI